MVNPIVDRYGLQRKGINPFQTSHVIGVLIRVRTPLVVGMDATP
jgi:hypothetical protein